MVNCGNFSLISQSGDSNEHHKHTFTRIDQLCVFGYKYTHLFWSTDKLDIYHVYIIEIYDILHAKYSYREIIHYQSHIKP